MMKRLMQTLGGVSALGLLLVLPVAAHAQAVYGSINGQVTDTTGAAIPNATITVSDIAKGTTVTATSNGSGEYEVEHLLADFYNVKCEASGFKSFEASNVQVFVDSSPKVSCQLGAGASSETVTVSADTQPELKTDRADVSTIFDAKETYDLPLGDRNFTNLQLLLPGAQVLGWSHAADENPQGSRQIQIDGQAFGGTAFELDGTDNQDPILGIIVINPPLDAVGEAKITTQNYDAEFGKAVSAVISSTTKSGSNTFHGSAFDFRTSTANQAIDPFNGQPPAPGLKNLFGGSFGGPILKDKLFFFGDYQGARQRVATNVTTSIPTNNLLQSCIGAITGQSGIPGCDFSEYASKYGANGVIWDKTTGKPYPGNTIPTASLSAPSINLLKDLNTAITTLYNNTAGQGYNNPEAPGDSHFANNFSEGGTGIFNSNQYDIRGDYQFSASTHIFGRFSRFTDTLSGTQLFGPNVGGPGFGLSGYGGVSTGANDSAALGADIAINAKLLTDIRLGYYRYNIIDNKNNPTVDYANQLGIPGENVGGVTGGSPGFQIANGPVPVGKDYELGSFLDVNRCNCPLKEREDQFQIVNNWTKIIGNHSFKFGADLRYARNLRVPSDTDRTGINHFGLSQTADPDGADGGLGLATFALGDVTFFERYVSVSTNAKEFQKRTFFFAQDTWRATPNLTVNYGLRYDVFFPEVVNAARNGSLMDLQTGYLQVAGVGNIPTSEGWNPDLASFSPRIGVAYNLNPKTVIRAGYGRSYDIGVFGSVFGHVVTQNLPVLAHQAVGNSNEGSRNPSDAIAFNLPAGPNAFDFPVTPANGLLPNPGYSVNSKARPDALRLPLLDAWNAAIQRSLTPTLSVTLAYVGNKGTHELGDGDSNNTNPNEQALFLPAQYSITGNALHYDPSAPGTPNAAGATSNATNLRRYFGGSLPACQDASYSTPNGTAPGACGWNQDISYYADALDTHYNAMQVTIQKQFSNGLQFTNNYQWASAFNYGAGYATWDKSYTYGRDSAVRAQQEVLYGTYNLPFGHGGTYLSGAHGIVDELIGHWQVSGTVNWSGGLPFTITDDNCGASVGGTSAPCYANSNNGARIATELRKLAPNQYSFFSGFGKTPSGTGAYENGFTQAALDQIGNSGRNTYFGPAFFNTDAAVQKAFPIHEALEAQFRMDTFNLFNHTNPGNPGGSIQTGGTIGGAEQFNNVANARYLQFSARIQF